MIVPKTKEELKSLFETTVKDGVVGTTDGEYLVDLIYKAAYNGGISWNEAKVAWSIIDRYGMYEEDTWVEGCPEI